MTFRELLASISDMDIQENAQKYSLNRRTIERYIKLKNALLSLPLKKNETNIKYIYIGKACTHNEFKEETYYEIYLIKDNEKHYFSEIKNCQEIIDLPILIDSLAIYGNIICAFALIEELIYSKYIAQKKELKKAQKNINNPNIEENLINFEEYVKNIDFVPKDSFEDQVEKAILNEKDKIGNHLVYTLLNDFEIDFKVFSNVKSVFNIREVYNLNHDLLIDKVKKGYSGKDLYEEFKKFSGNRIKIKKEVFTQFQTEINKY